MTTKSEYEERADAFLARHGMTFVAREGDGRCPSWCSETPGHVHGLHYRVTFRRYTNRLAPDGTPHRPWTLSFSFWNSQNAMERGDVPTAYDALAGLEKFEPGTFADWCSDFGESTDSIRARDIYRRVVAQWKRVKAFFTSEELEEMQEIQ